MDLNKKTMQRLALLIVFAVVLTWALTHPGQVAHVFSVAVTLLLPFLLGGCMAFLGNVFLRPIETGWQRLWGKKYGPRQKAAQRPVCLVVTCLLLTGIIFAIFFVVAPALQESVMSFIAVLPERLDQLKVWWDQLAGYMASHAIYLPDFSFNGEKLQTWLNNFFEKHGQAFVDATIGVTSSLFSLVVNLVLGWVFSLYILAQKETLSRQALKVVHSLFSQKRAQKIVDVARLTNRTFSSFVTGQLTEAVILGSLCFVGMLILRLPYAGVVSVLVGFTALIPIFGAFIGLGIGAFLILLVHPIQALWFILFFLILQQVEGNLIYPRVVGKSVGLPGIWVLVAVTLGGNAFGLVGMLLSVPLCSVLYALARQGVNNRLRRKGLLPVPDTVEEAPAKEAPPAEGPAKKQGE